MKVGVCEAQAKRTAEPVATMRRWMGTAIPGEEAKGRLRILPEGVNLLRSPAFWVGRKMPMDEESLKDLRLDRRLLSRLGWISPEELERELEALPDVSHKAAEGPRDVAGAARGGAEESE